MNTAVGLNAVSQGFCVSKIKETIGSGTFGVPAKCICCFMLLMTSLFPCRLLKQYQLAWFSLGIALHLRCDATCVVHDIILSFHVFLVAHRNSFYPNSFLSYIHKKLVRLSHLICRLQPRIIKNANGNVPF